jgi:hypothetical protein
VLRCPPGGFSVLSIRLHKARCRHVILIKCETKEKGGVKMKAIRTWRYVLLAVTLLWIMPQIAEAGRIDIWPHQFGLPHDTGISSAESEYRFFCNGSFTRGFGIYGCFLFAPVKLPVGRTVTKLKLYTEGTAVQALTYAILYRFRMGTPAEQMASVSSNNVSDLHAETITTINNATVRKNYLYYVRIYVHNEDSYVYGVKLYYK